VGSRRDGVIYAPGDRHGGVPDNLSHHTVNNFSVVQGCQGIACYISESKKLRVR